MKITSQAFADNMRIPVKYSYRGGNISPPLSFSNVPPNAKSLALICHDPDAPRQGGYYHWILWNIPPDTIGFEENKIANGVVTGINDFGINTWGGPAPPSGTHRYILYLYALDTILELISSTNSQQLLEAIKGHIIGKAELMGLFSA